ncbi:DNA topoisomerase [Altererythrobacter insulae]|nr:DNA topoisomerase [Altererythrobacter insulae]
MDKLIYIDDTLPGITRKGAGRGFAYYDPHGELITDPKERRRLNAIALPPAYVDAWFCPAPNGHILATGYDARGRKQYRYHPQFRLERESRKFDDCLQFGRLLPLLRKRVEEDLARGHNGLDGMIASIVRLLDSSAIRVGNETYTRDNETFGATTLRRSHVRVSGSVVRLQFRGKGGKDRDVQFNDAVLAKIVRRLQDLPGQRLFEYQYGGGAGRTINSTEVNAYLRETMGCEATAKYFRTWHGSVQAFRTLAFANAEVTIKALSEQVATRLGNTPAVTRRSYIHPAVIDIVPRQQQWRSDLRIPRRTKWLAGEERGLLNLLEESPAAEELLVA